MAQGCIGVQHTAETVEITVRGDWVLAHARKLARAVDNAHEAIRGMACIRIDASALGHIDTAGTWLLQKVVRRARTADGEVALIGFERINFGLVEKLEEIDASGEHCQGVRCYTLGDEFVGLGMGVHRGLLHLLDATAFIGRACVTMLRCAGRPARMRLPAIVGNIHRAGVNAIPIIALLSFLLAIVMAYQGANQLQRYGAEIFTIQLTVVSMLREMGPLITAIVVAGRSGSAFTAEIGVMKVREEIDAMMTMGLDPFEVLVLPRLFALIIMMPLLTLVADIAGMAGAAFTVVLVLDLPLDTYMASAGEALTPWNFWSGMLKAPVFGFLIATTATFWGMQVAGSADSVGRRTTLSVVQGIFLVIVADTIFSLVYLQLGF